MSDVLGWAVASGLLAAVALLAVLIVIGWVLAHLSCRRSKYRGDEFAQGVIDRMWSGRLELWLRRKIGRRP